MNTKQQLHQHCLQLLEERIRELEAAVNAVRESRNNETKSSAGDKYETGRAMMQQEEDKVLARMDNARQMRLQLQQLDPSTSTDQIGLGSLVQTDQRYYYLSVSLGKVVQGGTIYFCVSAEAPISKGLWGKIAGDELELNGRKESILAIL